MSKAIEDVMVERERQKGAEGWDNHHDDMHDPGVLAAAAGCYALHCTNGFPASLYSRDGTPPGWPWEAKWWKPKDMRRDLVRAAALIIAEIERLDRAAVSETPMGCTRRE